MKNLKIFILFSLFISFTACTKNKITFSDDYVYLKAGTVNIPNPQKDNYSLDTANNVLNINIPVYCYGAANNDNFIVDVTPDPDTVNALISNGQFTNATLLSPGVFTLPNKINIEKGKSSTIPISVNLNDVPKNANTLAFAVSISNSSKYFVYPAFKTVVILINYSSFFGRTGAFLNLKDQQFLAVNGNDLTISHDTVLWNITTQGNNVLIKNVTTGLYIKHIGNFMNNGFALGNYNPSDPSFLIHLGDATSRYNVSNNYPAGEYNAYAIGDSDSTTCIDSYGNGITGSWLYSEVFTKWFPNRVWVFIPKR